MNKLISPRVKDGEFCERDSWVSCKSLGADIPDECLSFGGRIRQENKPRWLSMGRNGTNGQEGSEKFFHGGLSGGKGQAGECLNVVGEIEVISKLIYKWCLNKCVLLCSGQKIGGKSPVVFPAVAGSASWDKVFGSIRPTAPVIMGFDVVGMSRPCAAVKTTTTNGYHGLKQALTFWC